MNYLSTGQGEQPLTVRKGASMLTMLCLLLGKTPDTNNNLSLSFTPWMAGWPQLQHGRLPKDQHPILAAACVNQPFKAGQTIITQGHLVAKLPGVGVDVSLESFVLFVVVFWIA